MLRQCVERCPQDVWVSGTHPRNFWRIAYHAVFFGHLYLMQGEAAFVPWEHHRASATDLWDATNTPVIEPYAREEVIEYIDWLDSQVEPVVDGLDLDSKDSGFSWYPDMAKLDHELMSIRHIQGHVGQLSELLMAHGVDTDWCRRVPR